MKYRIFTAIILATVVLNLGASTSADTKAKNANVNQLVSLLPASDGVLTFDVKRFFKDAVPQVLSGNQPMLAKVTAKVDEIQKKIGIDIRQFDEAVVGISARQIATKNYDIDPVVIARGPLTSASLLGAAKLASNGKYREERIGERVMYIFDVEKVASQIAQTAPTQNILGNMTEIGVASIEERTIAFGDVGQVRKTLEGKTRVGADLVGMLERSPGVVTAFAVKPPAGLKAFIPIENDELGKNIDSIQYLYGNANVAATGASVHVTARTLQNAQATSLHETLEGLQVIGKAFLGGSKGPGKGVYGRLIEGAKFSVKANEVVFDLSVPQTDIDILVGSIK